MLEYIQALASYQKCGFMPRIATMLEAFLWCVCQTLDSYSFGGRRSARYLLRSRKQAFSEPVFYYYLLDRYCCIEQALCASPMNHFQAFLFYSPVFWWIGNKAGRAAAMLPSKLTCQLLSFEATLTLFHCCLAVKALHPGVGECAATRSCRTSSIPGAALPRH